MLVNSSKINTSDVHKMFDAPKVSITKVTEEFKDIVDKSPVALQNQTVYIKPSIHMANVLELVCRVLRVDINEVKSRKRNRELVEARQIYSLLIINFSTIRVTKTDAGATMCKDHATVIHYIKQCINLSDTNAPYRKKVDKCILEFTKEFTSPEHYILDFNNIPQY